MSNKESGKKRPCYFCFRDKDEKNIIWFVPITTKYEKYEKIYNLKKEKFPKRPVYNFVFGSVLSKKAVFLIQNIFPATEKYIGEKYKTKGIDVNIPEIVKKEILRKAYRVIELAKQGINIPFYDILEIKSKLLEEND